MTTRKIIRIIALKLQRPRRCDHLEITDYDTHRLIALCDDGTVWEHEYPEDPEGEMPGWEQMRDIPQD